MARVINKDFTALDSVITIGPLHEAYRQAAIQYVSGAGTLLLEGSFDNDTYFPIEVASAAVSATVTAGTMTTVGGYVADVSGIPYVQLRKSVGAAACVGSLGVSDE